MAFTLIIIGGVAQWEAYLNSHWDPYTNEELATMTNEELAGRNPRLLSGSGVEIDHNIDGRATASFVIKDDSGALTFYERQQVIITDLDMNKSFAGILQEDNCVRVGRLTRFHTVSAADYTAILDRRNVDYSALDKLAGVAVRDIMVEYLTEEGVTEGYIAAGNLLTEISIGNKSVQQAYEKLIEACPGYVCYIDYDLKLYFHPRTLYAAPWNIYDETDILDGSLNITHSSEKYRNIEIVIGSYEETSLQTEPFVTDGVLKTFPLGYKVNRVESVTVNGVQKTIGKKGTDAGSYDCYYTDDSETLLFDVAPLAGIGEIKYYGLWRAKSKAEDLTEIARNKARMGGKFSGKVEHITIDESLTSITAAGEYATGKLAEYGVDGITVTYKTKRPGLAAGTLQHIKLQDIDHDFLIAKVIEVTQDGDTEFSVTAYYGPVGDEWDLYFRENITAVYQIREGVEDGTGVTKLFNFRHIYLGPDRPNPFTTAMPSDDLLPGSDTWPCFDPSERTRYIEFWRDGACVFRKQHTSTPDMTENDLFHSYSFISPAEAIGEIDEVVFFGGNSATSAFGSGVELYRAAFPREKTILESYQVNMEYVNGAS